MVIGLAVGSFAGYQLISSESNARQVSACYEIVSPDVPYMDTQADAARAQTWCYRTELDGKRVIYAVDKSGRTRPELVVIVQPDGTLKHASLAQGRLTVHELDSDWNPLGVPLTPPTDARRVPEPISALSDKHGVDHVLRFFARPTPTPDPRATPRESDRVFDIKVEEGSFKAQTFLPWRSFWYPQSSGRLHNGPQSPMAKYDIFVGKRVGMMPGAQSEEKRVHPPREEKWAGHCNGWAASSIMRPEPTAPVTDPYTGVTFSVSDQKGLWLEADYCPTIAFFGRRSFGQGNDGDVRPHVFHNVLSYYMGQLKKPVLFDLIATGPVENRVASAYEMTVKRTGPDTFYVTTKVTLHSYDNKPMDVPGAAGVFYRNYNYHLTVDEMGRPKSGRWTGRNPDFLWLPLAPGDCRDKNPVVNEAWLKEIHRLSLRPPTMALEPMVDSFPKEGAVEVPDTRPVGAAPKPEATPEPADRQPDEPCPVGTRCDADPH